MRACVYFRVNKNAQTDDKKTDTLAQAFFHARVQAYTVHARTIMSTKSTA